MAELARTRQTLRCLGVRNVDTAEVLVERIANCGIDLNILLDALPDTGDPDAALAGMCRILAETDDACAVLSGDNRALRAAALIAGASRPLADMICTHSQYLKALLDVPVLESKWWVEKNLATNSVNDNGTNDIDTAERSQWYSWRTGMRQRMAAVGKNYGAELDEESAQNALRYAYFYELLIIAAADLLSDSATDVVDSVSAMLSELADCTVAAAITMAHAIFGVPDVSMSVIALGKCGGRELNYCSDVDVIYVIADGATQEQLDKCALIANMIARMLDAPGVQPRIWPLDAALRPEGARGPLVRTLSSHISYYKTWAQSWEFQALLKARHMAGDAQLSQCYLETIKQMVWKASEREHFVADARAMRKRVEGTVRQAAAADIKLGPGGLRDVEFAIQLLQLVHGRIDESVRYPGTLVAISQIRDAGYIGREVAAQLDSCYRFERVLEHRLQLQRLRRTRIIPDDDAKLRVLGRAIAGEGLTSAEQTRTRLKQTVRSVRDLHQSLFYRPLLPAVAQLSADDLSLAEGAACARLKMLGYLDSQRAMKHISALVEGISRAAAIQRQLLPIMLAWFADGVDPDAGLARFRSLSEDLADSHWYLRLLRDSGSACQNLSNVLSTSRFIADGLRSWPEGVRWLDIDSDTATHAQIKLPSYDSLAHEAIALRDRYSELEQLRIRLQGMRSRELLRAAMSDALHGGDPAVAGRHIANINRLLVSTLLCAIRDVSDPEELPYAVVSLGSASSGDCFYASDIDIIVAHSESISAQQAHRDIALLKELVCKVSPFHQVKLDLDLRPEGKQGALTRTLDSYRAYYDHWALTWERQALLRAVPLAGNPDLMTEFMRIVDDYRYGSGLTEKQIGEVRRMKARVEKERLPHGVTPDRHIKLGPGGISDIEWTAQMLQLQNAYKLTSLRAVQTSDILTRAAQAGLIAGDDLEVLLSSHVLLRRLRAAIVLASGRVTGSTVDRLPVDRLQMITLAALMGYGTDGADALNDAVLGAMRRTRSIMKRLFYGVASEAENH